MSPADDPRRGPRRYGPSTSGTAADRGYHGTQQSAGQRANDLDNPWPQADGAATIRTPRDRQAPRYDTPRSYPTSGAAGSADSYSARTSGPGQIAGSAHRTGPTQAMPIGAPAWSEADAATAVIPNPGRGGTRTPPPPRPPAGPPRTGGGGSTPPPRRRTKGSVIAARIIAGFVAVVLLAVTGVAWATLGTTPQNASDATDAAGDVGVVTGGETTTDANGRTVTVKDVPATNILIVGSDARTDSEGNPLTPDELKAVSTQLDGGGVNTDTIMILHIPEGGQRATAISIPRDTWIDSSVTDAPGVVGPYSDGTTGSYKPNKINSFYGTAKYYEEEYLAGKGVTGAERERQSNEAGRTMLIKIVQQFTGIKINHYAEVNLIGFYLLSNAIGGVPVCLNNAVKDRQSGADFPAGEQTVQGKAALSFVRQRHGLPGGDLDRIRRQQAFLAGAANKILSVGTLSNPSKLSALVTAANRSLVLDKNFDLLSFGQQMVGLTSGHISFVTIPIEGTDTSSGTDALATDPAKIRSFFAALSATGTAAAGSSSSGKTSTAPSTVTRGAWTVDVQNATMTQGMAASVGQKAADAGFQRGQMSDYPDVTSANQQAGTSIRYPAGGEAAATQLRQVLGHGSLVKDDGLAAGHLLVIAGLDLPKPAALHGSAGGALLQNVTGSTEAAGAGSGSAGGAGSGSVSGSGGQAAVAATTSPAPTAATGVDGTGGDTINAAHPGCVN